MLNTKHQSYAYLLWMCLNFFVAVFSLWMLDKNVITDMSDGFTSQIQYIVSTPISEWSLLRAIHYVRYIIVWPMLFGNSIAGWIDGALILFLFFPFLSFNLEDKIAWLSPLLFYLPTLLSYRTCIGMCGMGLLYLALFEGKRNIYIFISALFAQMSSGIVLIWIAIFVCLKKYVRLGQTAFIVILFMMSFSIVVSLGNKLSFFQQQQTAVMPTEAELSNVGVIETAIARNTIFDSVSTGRFVRAGGYILYFTLACLLTLHTLVSKKYAKSIFFAFGISTFLVEGTAASALLIPLWLYFKSDFSLSIISNTFFKRG